MSDPIITKLETLLINRKDSNNFRNLSISSAPIDFCSNDYLGLSRSLELKNEIALRIANVNSGVGATGSRLISGNNAVTEETENRLARMFNGERALIFNSGYVANLGVLSSIPRRGDVIFYDELSHASVKDGIRLSLAQKVKFNHNDLTDLEEKLERSDADNKFIVVESIYSMDGDRCPLDELVKLSEKYEAAIILDEAHSTGVVGENGAGQAVAKGLEDKIFARVYTFGKAMGVHGACVVADNTVIDYLINFSRPFIYTTALPIHSVVSIGAAFSVLEKNPLWQEELQEKVNYFIQCFNSIFGDSLVRTDSQCAIQGVLISGNDEVKKVANLLVLNGHDVKPILSPTVREGGERIRICLHRYNTHEEIDAILNTLKLALS